MTSPFSPQPFGGFYGLTGKYLIVKSRRFGIPVYQVISRILFLLPLHLS